MLHVGQLDQSDLAGPLHMRRTAGAHIISRDHDDPDLSFDLDLAAVLKLLQFFLCRIERLDFQILPHRAVRFPLDLHQLLICEHTAEIHGAVLRAEMKSHVIISETGMDQSGHDMLAAVLLHFHETLFPVDPAGHAHSRIKRPVRHVQDASVPLLHIRHTNPAEHPCIRVLAAAFREKRCPV